MSYSFAFLAHFIAVAVAFGAAVCDMVINRVFWRLLEVSPPKAEALAPLMTTVGSMAAIGGLGTLGSGFALLASVQFAHWGARWLSLKLLLFVFLTANGLLFAKSRKHKVTLLMSRWSPGEAVQPAAGRAHSEATGGEVLDELRRIESSLRLFHRTQLGAFVLVFVLAVFKLE